MLSLTAARRRLLIALTGLLLLAYVGVAIMLEANALGEGLRRLGFAGAGAVLGLSLLNYLLRFWRWQVYVQMLGGQVPPVRHLAYYFAGFAFTVSPAKAGEAVRALYLRPHGVPVPHTFAALFAERVLDLLAVSLLAAICAGSLGSHRGAAAVLGAVILALAWLLGQRWLADALRRRAVGASRRVGGLLLGTAGMLAGARRLLVPARLYPALALGVVAWGAEGFGLWLLAQALQIPLSLEAAVAIYALGVLGGVLAFFMPGGIGGAEAAMTGLLVKAGGAGLAVATAVTLLCRFATLWFAVVLGIAALLLLEALPRPSRQRGMP